MLWKQARRMRRDNAEVGVGTLIIFIAMVLVAAVAAAVIIGTSGMLQQRAQQTGQDATADVSSNTRVVSVEGIRATAADDVGTISLYISLSAGAPPIDLSETVIRYTDGGTPLYYKYGDPTNAFTLTWIRGGTTDTVIESGDLVEVRIALATELAPRSDFQLQLVHIVGAAQELDLSTPALYGDNLYLDLQ